MTRIQSAVAPTSLRANSRPRVLAILAAVVGTVVVWLSAQQAIDGNVLTKNGSGSPQAVSVVVVIIATVLAGLAGWGLLALLERNTSKARTIWAATAVVLLVVSLAAPLTSGDGGGSKLALTLMHLVAAAAIIPIFVRTSARH